MFINWIRDNTNNIIGFKYWSTQESSDSGKGTIDRSQLYIGRVGSLENYMSFNK